MNVDQELAAEFWDFSVKAFLFSATFVLTCGSLHAQAAAEAAGATSVTATAASGAKTLGFPSSKALDTKDKSPHLPASAHPPSDVANRQTLERRAGPDAGRLFLRSMPSGAEIWIDGSLVGRTPMLLFLAPGKYQVELRGDRLEHARRVVDLLPHENREVTLALQPRYPTRVTVH